MVSKSDAQLVLEKALASGADFAELYFEDKHELNISFGHKADGITDIHVRGVGLYLIAGTSSVYTYTNDTGLPAMMDMCQRACELLRKDNVGKTLAADFNFRIIPVNEPNPVVIYPSAVSHGKKIQMLVDMDRAIMSRNRDVKSLSLNYYDAAQRVTIANSEGVWAEDQRINSRIRILPFLANDTDSVGYPSFYTRPAGFEAFDHGLHIDFAQKAIDEMRGSLDADEAPCGFMPVVFEAGGCSGTFFHEACGHQFETYAILNHGIFADRIGGKVASDKVTLIDDGTMSKSYGSSKYDDEGMPRQKNVLIENGIMKSYLSDRLGALKLHIPRTASGRRQGYTFAPSARMSNTYLAAGTDDPDEMIRTIDNGLFVTRLGGGSGEREFTLATRTAYLIKGGKIDRRVKGALLLGRGDETMFKIDRVGNVMQPGDGGGFCGSVSGLCATTTGGARMRVCSMLVGGRGDKQ